VFGAGAGNQRACGPDRAFTAYHKVDGAGDPFRRVDPVRRRSELRGTGSARKRDQSEDDADHEPAESCSGDSGRIAVFLPRVEGGRAEVLLRDLQGVAGVVRWEVQIGLFESSSTITGR
jgi:hypothetical protein